MPRRKTPEADPGAFERMARELGCDESGEAFERAFAEIVPPKKPGEVTPLGHAPETKEARRSGPPESGRG